MVFLGAWISNREVRVEEKRQIAVSSVGGKAEKMLEFKMSLQKEEMLKFLKERKDLFVLTDFGGGTIFKLQKITKWSEIAEIRESTDETRLDREF
jgi:hypothetical protein